MRKEFVFTFFSLFLVSLFSSCTENATNDKVLTFWVNSSTAECAAGAGLRQCLQIYRGDDPTSAEWEYFYEDIKGFDFEPGYFQQLEVKESPREKGKVPMDASTLEYTLVKVLNKIEDSRFALNGKWTAVSISGAELTDQTASPVLEVDLQKMQVSGNNACNNYTGGIETLTDSVFKLGNIASTKKMCMDMSIPDSYDQALTKAMAYKLVDGKLELLDKDGVVTVAFTKN